MHIKVSVLAIADDDIQQPQLDNSYFSLIGVKNENGISLDTIISGDFYNSTTGFYESLDSYNKLHYQTALICDDNTEYSMDKLLLDTSSTAGVKVYNAVTGGVAKPNEELQWLAEPPLVRGRRTHRCLLRQAVPCI